VPTVGVVFFAGPAPAMGKAGGYDHGGREKYGDDCDNDGLFHGDFLSLKT
jgi:hypothetical protein